MGRYIAKIKPEYLETLKNKKDGKLILVTAITPTPAGEGKTTTSVSYTHLRAHETSLHLVCRLLLEKKKAICPAARCQRMT